MVQFDVAENTRKAMAPHHRAVQAAIAVLASRAMGVSMTEPEGIWKYEGGVRIGDRDVAIFEDCVRDDWKKYDASPKPEETAVARAIEEVAARFKYGGPKVLAEFGIISNRDPLRAFFGEELELYLAHLRHYRAAISAPIRSKRSSRSSTSTDHLP